MKLTELIAAEAISVPLDAGDKESAIRALVHQLVVSGQVAEGSEADVVKALLKRESLGSTAIGRGVCVPNAKHPAVEKIACAVGVSETATDADAIDGEPVFVFFLVLSPPDLPGDHLTALESVARSLRDDTFVRFLKQCKSPNDVWQLLEEYDAHEVVATNTVPAVYQSVKIVLVGESNVGKSSLAMRLAEDRFPDDHEQGATHGMRLWPMEAEELHPAAKPPEGHRRDVVLWELGGQDEYQLVHQLFLQDATLAMVLIDPTRGRAALSEAREWNKRLEKHLNKDERTNTVKLLVGAKVDKKRDLIDQNSIDAICKECGFVAFLELSAKTGRNIKRLRKLISEVIDWDHVPTVMRPELFQFIRDEIEDRRRAGEVLLSMRVLTGVVKNSKLYDKFDERAVDGVCEQLNAQGMLIRTNLANGEPGILLNMPVVARYAGSLIVAARNANPNEPALEEALLAASAEAPLPGISNAERLERDEERIVLNCIVDLMIKHDICRRENGALVFPSLFTSRDEQLIRQARQLLVDGEYERARQQFIEIIDKEPDFSPFLRDELGFVFDFDADEASEREKWKRRAGQIEWRRSVWSVVAQHDIEFVAEPEETTERPAESEEDVTKKDSKEKKAGVTELTSEAKGEALEQATLRLLKLLFPIDETEAERLLQELSQQQRGSQLGFDVKLTYYHTDAKREVRCFIECKSQESALTLKDVLEKVEETHMTQSNPDHWIVIAPRAVAQNKLKTALDHWRDAQKYPFDIHVWTEGTEVHELFGLDTKLFDIWFEGKDIEGPHPSAWSAELRNDVISRWRQRLTPPLRLPAGWDDYVLDHRHLRTFSDESEKVLSVLREQYIEPRCLDETGAPLSESISETIDSWLASENRSLILLGDFGDGKTVATYLLTLRLVEQFRVNPNGAWLPLRCSLRDFSRPNITGGREFLRRRLEEFGANIAGWRELTENHNVFVILDGVDEMTTSLDSESIKNAVNRLLDCCREEFGEHKVMLTCRTPFYQVLPEREYLLGELDAPLVITLRNFERRSVIDHLASQANTTERRKRLQSLRTMHDPIGLATKPLFFQMVSDTLWDPDADCTSEIALYESYIRKCLSRKAELLQPESSRVSRDELIGNMIGILEQVAIEIHRGQKEFACLKRIASLPEYANYARVLWERASADQTSEEDATSRVGIRSLLRRVNVSDSETSAESWPVDFCHRSIREYFVARKLESVIRESVSQARELLAITDLSIEIVHFTASLMRAAKQRDAYHAPLRSLAQQSRASSKAHVLDQAERVRLGKNAVTLLFKAEGELAELDWDNMALDGADLAGANLSRKNFSGTSLRNSILDNVDFTEANFSNADLTGVQFDETAEVRSISVLGRTNEFIAAYDDGCVRIWSLATTSSVQSRKTFELAEAKGSRVDMSGVPGSDLCLHVANQLIFADAVNDRHEQVAAIRTRPEVSRIVFKDRRLLVVEEEQPGRYQATLFAVGSGKAEERYRCNLGSSWLCDCYGEDLVVTANQQDGIVLYRLDKAREVSICKFEAPSALAISATHEGHILIGCGNQHGDVRVMSCKIHKNGVDSYEVLSRRPHQGAITSIAFIEDHSVLTGGNDRRIVRLDLRPESKDPIVSEFRLHLRCAGMEVSGMESEIERDILVALGAHSVPML